MDNGSVRFAATLSQQGRGLKTGSRPNRFKGVSKDV